MKKTEGRIGKDYIGVGVGALIFNEQGQFLMSLRGPKARNEQGRWEIPGGKVEWGETLAETLIREIKEEIGVDIEVLELLTVSDHLLRAEGEHWVSPTFICKITSGTPIIMEPEKCAELRWFSLDEAETMPLSVVTQSDVQVLRKRGYV